jgi:DNA/RNA endonuclease YhcR with UshA esterase domain
MTGKTIRPATWPACLAALLVTATALSQTPKNLDDDYVSENECRKLHGQSAPKEEEEGPKKLTIVTPTIGKLDAIDVLDTDKLVQMSGQVVTVQGMIVRAHHDKKSDTRFFNFDKNREKFSFVMFGSAAKLFQQQGEPTEYYLDKKIQVTGVLTIHKGKPSMVVSKPEQIVLVR